MEPTKAFHIHMPESLYDRLKDQAACECVTMAAVVRRAVDEYCGRFEVPAGPKLGRRREPMGAAAE